MDPDNPNGLDNNIDASCLLVKPVHRDIDNIGEDFESPSAVSNNIDTSRLLVKPVHCETDDIGNPETTGFYYVSPLPYPFFDTQSEAAYYAIESSSPSMQTPTGSQINRDETAPNEADTIPRPENKKSVPNWKIISHVRKSQKKWGNKITFIRKTFKREAGLTSKPWQLRVLYNIVYLQMNVVVSAGTGSGKSLPYMLIPLILIRTIVLVVSPTIALMNNQIG